MTEDFEDIESFCSAVLPVGAVVFDMDLVVVSSLLSTDFVIFCRGVDKLDCTDVTGMDKVVFIGVCSVVAAVELLV